MKELKTLLEKAKNDSRIIAVFLFGSYATKKHAPKSDIDICLVLRQDIKDYSSIRLQYLAELPSHYDIQIFQQLPLYIRIKVLKEGK